MSTLTLQQALNQLSRAAQRASSCISKKTAANQPYWLQTA
jgi:hypothetical protein